MALIICRSLLRSRRTARVFAYPPRLFSLFAATCLLLAAALPTGEKKKKTASHLSLAELSWWDRSGVAG